MRAEEPRGAAVLVTQAAGAGELPRRLGMLAAEIVSQQARVVRPDEAERLLAPQGLDPITCGIDTRCLAEAGARLGVRFVIAVGVGRFGDLWGLDVRALDVVRGGEPRVASATYADPGPDWTAAMREALSRVLPVELGGTARAVLAVRTREPGAEVRLDGNPVGSTPTKDMELAPGPHRVEVRREGHAPSVRDVNLSSGERAELELPLVPLGEPPPRGPWAWITGGTGVAALAAAVVLHAGALSMSREANDLTGLAREERHAAAGDRMAAAAVLYGVGAAAAIATGYLLAQ